MSYSKLKVNDLKELLKEKGLATSGTKNELIARLEEAAEAAPADTAADASAPADAAAPADAPAPAAPPADAPAAAPAPADAAAPADAPAEGSAEAAAETATEPAAAETKTESTPATKAEPETKAEPTPEEAAAALEAVVAELQKRITRHKRFGTDASDAEARLKRVQQFGLVDVAEASRMVTLPALDTNRKRFKNRKGNKVTVE